MITLSCRPSSDLKWDQSDFPSKGEILWYFDLGLEDPFFPIDDLLHFESLKMALKKFTDEIWPRYRDRTKGAVLFKGKADFSTFFRWTDSQKENFEKWKKGVDSEIELRIFTANAYRHYFQMLSFCLPDELPLFLLLDANIEGTIAEKHLLLSKERYEHFQIAIRGLPFTSEMIWDEYEGIVLPEKSTRAICFPPEEMCTPETLSQLMDLFNRVEKPLRVIFETHLNEDWEGIDDLYYIPSAVSIHGIRKIKGFEAAGGRVSG